MFGNGQKRDGAVLDKKR